jgi:hypothetical protein
MNSNDPAFNPGFLPGNTALESVGAEFSMDGRLQILLAFPLDSSLLLRPESFYGQ